MAALRLTNPSELVTPSGWHESASKRDAGHDELVLRALRELSEDAGPIKLPGRYKAENARLFKPWRVECEYPVMHNGRIISFIDVAQIFWHEDTSRPSRTDYEYLIIAWEIKPNIGSAGALLRQCKANKVAIQRDSSLVDEASVSGTRVYAVCGAAFYDDDPKKDAFLEMAKPAGWMRWIAFKRDGEAAL